MTGALPVQHDRYQAAALEALASADGGVLSYDQLEAQGVSRPASVGYELAAAGWPIRRAVIRDADGRRRIGLRMLPGSDVATVARPAPRHWGIAALLGIAR